MQLKALNSIAFEIHRRLQTLIGCDSRHWLAFDTSIVFAIAPSSHLSSIVLELHSLRLPICSE